MISYTVAPYMSYVLHNTFKNEEPSYVITGRGKDSLMKSVFGVNTWYIFLEIIKMW